MKSTYLFLSLAALLPCTGCERFLSEKSDKSFVLADKLENLQALLDHPTAINNGFEVAGEGSTDDYYLTTADLDALREDLRDQHTWQPDGVFPIAAVASNGWRTTYDACFIHTTVLEALADIPRSPGRETEWDAIKGQALVNRAYRYLNAVSVWAPAYDPQTAATDWGIPLRLDPDMAAPTVRATLEETFHQLIGDAQAAIPLLPETNINAHRAAKPFAYGLLARAYWYMRQYDRASAYADSCLQRHDFLRDFNGLNAAAAFPIANTDPEIIRFGAYQNANHTNPARAKIDAALYASYTDDDLRKAVFFSRNTDGSYRFKGNYTGSATLFAGMTTSELLLIRAECRARAGDVTGALADVNRLRRHRIRTDDFVPVSADSPQEALTLVLTERRKELLMRGLRWMDIKRLNKEGANITLTREIDGQVRTLPPNDPRYALAIPEDIIELTGIPQNAR